jgi:hypothetical protein
MVSLSSSQTATVNASQNPAVPVPTDAANGDTVYAFLSYGGADPIATQPSGWTVVSTGTYSSTGSFSLVKRTMAAGVTQAQWTITTNATGYGKSSMVSIAVKAPGTETVGTLLNRSTNITTSVLPGVTVATGGVLLAFAGDRVSGQTTVSLPTGMTEEAKQINNLTGGTTAVIGSQFPAAGASGTRTITYGVASTNAAGLLLTVAPAGTGTTVPVVTITPATAAQNTGVARTLSGTVSGATSQVWSLESSPPLAAQTITNSTSATTASYTPTIAGTYVFRLTATNTAGTSSDTFTLTVSGSTSKPVSVVSNAGNFLPVGAASIEEALSDALDSSTAEGGQTTGPAFTVQYGSLTPTTAVTWHVRADVSAAPNATCVFNLLQGTAVVATRTQAVTTTTTTYSYVLTTAEVGAITNWSDLRLQVSVS